MFHLSLHSEKEAPKPYVNLKDRISHAEGRTLAFMAEHSYKLSDAPDLVAFAKEMSQDRRALDGVQMGRASATYKMVHGMGTVAKKRLVHQMQTNYFSLNLDEGTSKNNKKVLSVMVCYFCPEKGESVVQHYNSVSLTVVNAKTITQAVVNMLESDKIPLCNLISVLCDSANYMRGKSGGFETLLRQQHANHMLDIDGDVCHHIHNTSRKFCGHFNRVVEQLVDDLHTDFKYSTDLREYLEEICEILQLPYHMPKQRVPHRWLSVLNVLEPNEAMLDGFTLLYWAWIPTKEQELYQDVIDEIMQGLPVKSMSRIAKIIKACKVKNLTEDGKKRKRRLVDKLFYTRDNTFMHIYMYLSILPMFRAFVLTFEQKQPLVHRVHEQHMSLLQHFLCCFIKEEKVSNARPSQLKKLDLEGKANLQSIDMMFVGSKARKLLAKKTRVARASSNFLPTVQKAYIDAGKYLVNKLPITNVVLRRLAAVDPVAVCAGHSATASTLQKLVEYFPTVISSDEEKDAYIQEVIKISCDPTLPSPYVYEETLQRADYWWAQVFDRYPTLGKVVRACLSIILAPHVEQHFSQMNNYINEKTNRLEIRTFNAVQTFRYHLKSEGKTSLELFHRPDPCHSPVDSALIYHLQTARARFAKSKPSSDVTLAAKQQKSSAQEKALKLKKMVIKQHTAKRKRDAAEQQMAPPKKHKQ